MAPYQPIGTGYNRGGPNTGYGFTGVLEQIKSNNLFEGEFNNRTASQVKQGVLDKTVPRTGWPKGSTSAPAQPVMPSGSQPVMSNPSQYLTGGQQSPAMQSLLGQPLDAYDSMRDTNNNGIIDPWEM